MVPRAFPPAFPYGRTSMSRAFPRRPGWRSSPSSSKRSTHRRLPRWKTASSATGWRRISASRSTRSTWFSGTRLPSSRSCCGPRSTCADRSPRRMSDGTSPQTAAAVARGRRTILLVAAACLAPVLASYVVYFFYPRSAEINYGTLLKTAPAPPIEGLQNDGASFRLADLRGRWVLVAAGAGCDAGCERTLYAMRQAHTMQGKERERVVRVWLDTGGAEASAELRT